MKHRIIYFGWSRDEKWRPHYHESNVANTLTSVCGTFSSMAPRLAVIYERYGEFGF